MEATAAKIDPPSRWLLLLEGRALWELGVSVALLPWLRMTPLGDGHPVLVLPGLAASDVSTRPLRGFLKERGYAAHGWAMGRNDGRQKAVTDLVKKVKELKASHGRKVSLIGWSLGGVFAREMAKRAPDDVRLVITLGSPFTGNPKATNAWRLYQFLSGRKVGDPRVHDPLREPPPVPTTSIFSRTDGVVAWQCSVENPGPLTENIEVHGSHCGLGHNPLAVYAIMDRLAQPEGKWAPFDRGGLRALLFPTPPSSPAFAA